MLTGFLVNGVARDARMSRGVLNEMANFIDIVVDSGYISEARLRDFHLAIASYGILANIQIERYSRVLNPAPGGTVQEVYIQTPNIEYFERGDLVSVRINAIEYTTAQRLMGQFLRFSSPSFDESLAGMVRR